MICDICGKDSKNIHLHNWWSTWICSDCEQLCEKIYIMEMEVYIHPKKNTKVWQKLLAEYQACDKELKLIEKKHSKLQDKIFRKLKPQLVSYNEKVNLSKEKDDV